MDQNSNIVPVLGIGPLSSEVIEAVFQYSQENNISLMLISSKNQIDHSGGYVNGWNTQKYAKFIQEMKKIYPDSQVFICRDHCGPGFNGVYDLKDTYKTIDADIKNNFDLIHVDLCHIDLPHQGKLKKTKEVIQYIQKKAPQVLLEVGTDENIGKNLRDLGKIEKDLMFFNSFCKPVFYVSQTGSLIMEDRQVGSFDKIYNKKLAQLLQRCNLKLKEHNCDYLSSDQIKNRVGISSALNIAPQFGVLQTQLVLQKCTTYGISTAEFLEVSYKSKKWSKWITKKNIDNKLLCCIVAGHYNFKDKSYKKIIDQLSKCEGIREFLITEHKRLINHYINNFQS